jgi:hypothetical protein
MRRWRGSSGLPRRSSNDKQSTFSRTPLYVLLLGCLPTTLDARDDTGYMDVEMIKGNTRRETLSGLGKVWVVDELCWQMVVRSNC